MSNTTQRHGGDASRTSQENGPTGETGSTHIWLRADDSIYDSSVFTNMNRHRHPTRSERPSQATPSVTIGIDFWHAVEFSRSGRAPILGLSASQSGLSFQTCGSNLTPRIEYLRIEVIETISPPHSSPAWRTASLSRGCRSGLRSHLRNRPLSRLALRCPFLPSWRQVEHYGGTNAESNPLDCGPLTCINVRSGGQSTTQRSRPSPASAVRAAAAATGRATGPPRPPPRPPPPPWRC
jgi:hypothetical protein